MENKTNKFVEFFKNKLVIHTIIASVCLIVGILFCVIPTQTLGAIQTISMIAFLAIGFIATIIYCLAPEGYHNMKWLGIGVVFIGLGLLLVYVSAAFVISLALLIILSGAVNLYRGIKQYKSDKQKDMWFEIVFGAVIALLGLAALILSSTKIAENIVMIMFGVMLILKGVFDIVLLFVLKKEGVSIKGIIKSQSETEQTKEIEETKTEENNSSESSENS